MNPDITAQERVHGHRILRERAIRLAKPREDVREGTGLELLVFTLGQSRFALETCQIEEVFSPRAWTRLPGTPPQLRGIVNWRGRIVPVVDPSFLLGLPPRPQESSPLLLLVDVEPSPACLPVESVDSILNVNPDAIFPPPPTIEVGIARFIRGILSDGTALLDVRALLSDVSMVF